MKVQHETVGLEGSERDLRKRTISVVLGGLNPFEKHAACGFLKNKGK